MGHIVVITILIITVIVVKIIFRINVKKIKNIAENNKELDEIVKKYPSNIEICKSILKKLNNEKVKIQEDKEANNCLYIAVSDKILIANMRESFTRIQTIAHECLHSVQDRRILLFNFIYSCFYVTMFYISSILGVLKLIQNKMIFICIYIILSYVYFFIRSYLENDAMIKAKFLAEKYMEDEKISNKNEIKKIISEYDKLNNIGIKTVDYSLFTNTVYRTIILALIFLIR